MNKKRLYGVMGLVFVLCLAAGIKGFGKKEVPFVPDFVLTYAENHAEDYPTSQGARRFAELVYEKTEGRVVIQVNAGGVLGDEKAIIEQLQFGGVDFSRVSLSPLAEFVPRLNVLQLPYLYSGHDHMWRVLDGPIGDEFMNCFGGSGLVALSWYDAGARSFYNTKKPVEHMEDLKGMKIRIQESGLMEDLVRALGAVPVPLAFGDVYSALQTGSIDGAENNWPSYESTRHYEVAKYYTVDEHTRVPELQLVSSATWEKLPSDYQEIIRSCARESAKYERSLWVQREKLSEERMKAAGCQVFVLSQEEKARFRKAVEPLYEKYCGPYMDVVEKISTEEQATK